METFPFDRPADVLAGPAGRRGAVRVLATATASLLATLGLGGAGASGQVRPQRKRKRRKNNGSGGATGPAPSAVTRFGQSKRETGVFVRSVATCEPGEHAVGGGYFLAIEDTDQIIDFVASIPDPFTDGTVPTGWSAEANAVFPGGDKEIQAFAICVPD